MKYASAISAAALAALPCAAFSQAVTIADMNAQNSCTCGSEAALVSVDVPRASAAHSTKFSVVVTDA